MDVQQLIKENMKLVSFVIKNKRLYIPNRLDIQDLYQEGYVLLIKAANSYKENTGNEFSTYAINTIYLGLRAFVDRYFEKRYSFQGDSLDCEIYKNNSEKDDKKTWKDLLEDEDPGFEQIILEDAIKKSKIKDIEKIINFKIQGYEIKEIQKELGLSRPTVDKRLKGFKQELLHCG